MINKIFVILLMMFAVSACVHQQPDTQVSETHQRDGKLPWPDDAIILDVRSRFDYNLGHWPKAYNLPAHEAKIVDRDLKRRLALLGVHPRFVLVLVGNQKPDSMAKDLRLIGLENIRTFAIQDVKLPLTREAAPQAIPKPVW